MGIITVKFIGKEYSIPEDILTYIDLLDFTENIRERLISAFVSKVKKKIQNDSSGLLGNDALATEMEQQVGKFIAKLCDNGIFTRTINDYLKNSKGYQLYSDVNKAALEKIKTLLKQEMEDWRVGYEQAVNKADSHVTGMGFSIWSSSFVNHAIYAAMESSAINKQAKEAEAQYQKDIDELSSRLDSQYGGEKSKYISQTYIPNMEAALTVFAYELLDKYVGDLIANGKFDSKTLEYVDISRSNDLLKNLTLSNNKQAVLENAFVACPYNIAVYMQAMKYDLLDYDSFQTAKVFNKEHKILSFIQKNLGEVLYPAKFNINYKYVNLLALFTGETSTELLHRLTEQYAISIEESYAEIADMISDKSCCRRVVENFEENTILSDTSICKQKAYEYVRRIVGKGIWEQLIGKCGHSDLFVRIKNRFQSTEQLNTRKEFDEYLLEQLIAKLEEARNELAEQIKSDRAEEERQWIARQREQEQKKANITAKVKKTIKRTLIVIGGVVAACIALVITGIIFLFATDKPIDDDFAKSYEDSLHRLTYSVPDNWNYSSDESSENESCYIRYDNWGNLLGVMVVSYEGESPDVATVDSIVAKFKEECSTAKSRTENIDGQEFEVVTFVLESSDATPFFYNIYVTEIDDSVFYVSFIFIEESNKTDIFDEIIGAMAFDEYVNPKDNQM